MSGLSLYGELTALVDATQLIDDVVSPAPLVDVSITDHFAGDGSTILWLLGYVVDRNAPLALLPRLTVDGVPQLVTTGSPSTTCPEFAIVSLSASVDALITGSAPIPPGGADIALTYAYLSSAYVRLQDPSPINAYDELANLGKFTSATSGSSSGLTVAQALALARNLLTGYSTPLVKIDAVLEEDYRGHGFRKAQAVTFTSNRLGLLGLELLVAQPEWNGSKGFDQKRLHLTMEG